MKNIRENKAITLIALVITIIILLILAGITITQLSDNGLFGKSQEAKERSENAIEKEETELAKYENEIKNYIGGNRDYATTNYSTDEQDTGIKWTNNKNVYQKTYRNISITSSIGTAIANADLPPIDELIDLSGIVKITTSYGNEYYSTSTYWGTNCFVTLRYLDSTGVTYLMGSWTAATADITIRYTKK